MDAVVLAAGRGTRMGPLTEARPKPLLPVGGDPMIERIVEGAASVVDRFVIVVGYKGDAIREALGSTIAGVPIAYVEQPDQVGTADAVRVAAETIDGSFLVLNGDVVVDPSVIDELASTPAPAMVGTMVDRPSEYGVLTVSGDRLTGIVEKPDDPPSSLINAGLYHLDESLAAAMGEVDESARGEYELTDALEARIPEGDVTVVAHDGFWQDVGYPWDLLTVTDHLFESVSADLGGSISDAATVEGPVVIEDGARLDAGAVVRGPVVVKAGASIGPNAYVRDGAVVGPNVRIGHGVEVKGSILMQGATVAHLSYVGDSVLGPDVNFGAGTTVANLRHDGENVRVRVKGEPIDTGRRKFGVVIGDGAHTAINTSLNAGVVLPPKATTLPGEAVLRDP